MFACLISREHTVRSLALIYISLISSASECLFTYFLGLGFLSWKMPLHVLPIVCFLQGERLQGWAGGWARGWAGGSRMEAVCVDV